MVRTQKGKKTLSKLQWKKKMLNEKKFNLDRCFVCEFLLNSISFLFFWAFCLYVKVRSLGNLIHGLCEMYAMKKKNGITSKMAVIGGRICMEIDFE